METATGTPRRTSKSISAEQSDAIRRVSLNNGDMQGLSNAASWATRLEKEQTLWESVKMYRKGIAWSMLLSTAIIMEGYDTLLLSNLYGLPQFQARYGTLESDGKHVISAAWRSGLNNGANVGEILGLFLTGIIQERFGYRKTMIGALSLVVCFIFIVFFAQSLTMLLIGEILSGLPWGVFQTLTTAYAADVCPTHLRAYLTTYVNICWVLGQFIASGVLRAVLQRSDEWAYRIPFALQWMWPVPLIIGCFLAPESPYWLVRKGRIDEARRSLERLGDTSTEYTNNTLTMIQYTNEIEKTITAGTSYWDCFRGINLRRTEIVCVVWLFQNWCGNTFMGYSTTFYEQAGLAPVYSFDLTMGQYALGVCGTVGSWLLMKSIGRRSIYILGSCALMTLLLVIALTSFSKAKNVDWAIGSMLLIFTFTYDLTVGPVCYSLVAELSSTRLRGKSIVLARNLYNIGGIVSNVITNYQLTPTAWNWGAKSGFFWAGSCAVFITWMFFRLPEPKDRSYAELDILFEQKVSARNFKSTDVSVHLTDHVFAPEQTEKPMFVTSEDVKPLSF